MTDVSERFWFDQNAKIILVNTGKVEIGQHVHRAFQKIVAQELEVDRAHIRVSAVTTDSSPDDGMTVGSLSMQVTGASIKSDAISLRTSLIREAADKLGTDLDNITLDPNTLEYCANGLQCSIFELPTAKCAIYAVNSDDCELVDSTENITRSILGERQYIQDLTLPGMVHARALRGRKFQPRSSDNVRVTKDGGFTALVAGTEPELERAWARVGKQPAARDASCDGPVADWIQKRRVETETSGQTGSLMHSSTSTISQIASRPFILHASIAPSCAIARFRKGVLEIWTHSQGIFPLRDTIARYLGMRPEDVIVRHVSSAGCYGHNAADDAAIDAALISLQNEGTPVRVVWTRQDDFQYSPVGAAMQVQIEAQLSVDHSISCWRQTIWSCPHAQRPGSAGNLNLLAATERDQNNKSKTVSDLPAAIGGGSTRNATPPYVIKSFGVTSHLVQDLPVRTSSIRGLGAQMNVVCIEATMDKLAGNCSEDPLEFRLNQLDDPRSCEVLTQLRSALDTASVSLQDHEAIGIGYSRYKGKAAYAAVAAHVRLTDKVELVECWSVVDAGYIVDRSGAINQIEGGIIQAASWTLCEGAMLRNGYINAEGWEDYPILGWSDIPEIHTFLVGEREDNPCLGVGECMVGPASAAIVNGVGRVTGTSMADLPLTREKFLQVAAGTQAS